MDVNVKRVVGNVALASAATLGLRADAQAKQPGLEGVETVAREQGCREEVPAWLQLLILGTLVSACGSVGLGAGYVFSSKKNEERNAARGGIAGLIAGLIAAGGLAYQYQSDPRPPCPQIPNQSMGRGAHNYVVVRDGAGTSCLIEVGSQGLRLVATQDGNLSKDHTRTVYRNRWDCEQGQSFA